MRSKSARTFTKMNKISACRLHAKLDLVDSGALLLGGEGERNGSTGGTLEPQAREAVAPTLSSASGNPTHVSLWPMKPSLSPEDRLRRLTNFLPLTSARSLVHIWRNTKHWFHVLPKSEEAQPKLYVRQVVGVLEHASISSRATLDIHCM